MCGIAGYWQPEGWRDRDGEGVARRMAETLRTRGPDDSGTWGDAAAGMALGFRRLAIVDRSAMGHQPMVSPSRRHVMVFNGEIYNAPTLRPALEHAGARFRGHSDSEVLLAAIEHWGFEDAIERVRGMFAVAVWDAGARALWLARDPFGEKPLYYGWTLDGSTLLFASELHALRVHPRFRAEVDRQALVRYARYGYIPAPLSVFAGIGKLPPGSLVRITSDDRTPVPRRYFVLEARAAQGHAAPTVVGRDEGVDRMGAVLQRAVREQMVADVPLGAFLSGGIDSSLIVALMQRESARPVRTFCIGFDSPKHDEAMYAQRVADALGTDHTMMRVDGQIARDVVPDLARIYDEPFADSSQIPTVLVARLARTQVTVALTGDGGDELFGGYHRYAQLRRAATWMRLPGRRPVARMLAQGFAACGGMPGAVGHLAESLARRAVVAGEPDLQAVYAKFMSLCYDPERVVPGVQEPAGWLPLSPDVFAAGNPVDRAMLADQLQYLPDDLLVKVDRAAMSVGLESRMPFLDREVATLAWQLPFTARFDGKLGKAILRTLLARDLPVEWFARPKQGFMVPIAPWLRGPLRPWAESLLDERAMREEGMLDARLVRKVWSRFLGGSREWHAFLWSILMWRAWSSAAPDSRAATP